MRNECYTYFQITGSFDPDEITDLMGLKPDKCWKIGDLRKNGTVYDFSSWSFGRCDEYHVHVVEQMRETIAPLWDKMDVLQKIRREYEASFEIKIVPTVYAGESAPCLAPSLDMIDFCHATRTEIDIDLYVVGDEK